MLVLGGAGWFPELLQQQLDQQASALAAAVGRINVLERQHDLATRRATEADLRLTGQVDRLKRAVDRLGPDGEDVEQIIVSEPGRLGQLTAQVGRLELQSIKLSAAVEHLAKQASRPFEGADSSELALAQTEALIAKLVKQAVLDERLSTGWRRVD